MKRLLIVDDEVAIVEALQDVLASEGYEVHTAYNGAEGLKRLGEVHPDLVLLDMMMPVMDGRELLHRMSQDEAFKKIPVIVMSAGRISEEERRISSRFLAKPFELDVLLATIAEEIEKAAHPPDGKG